MTKLNVIRAWKDEAYRATLSEEDLASLPVNPAGAIQFSDSMMQGAAEATTSRICAIEATTSRIC